MDVIRPWLLIGKLAETLDLSLLRDANVGAMLQLCRAVEQPGINSLFLNVDDGVLLTDAMLARGIAYVREQKAQERVTLVACGRGASRSASFALAALKEENLGLLDAFREVAKAHPEARPHPLLWESLCRYYGESVPFIEMFKACRPVPKPWL